VVLMDIVCLPERFSGTRQLIQWILNGHIPVIIGPPRIRKRQGLGQRQGARITCKPVRGRDPDQDIEVGAGGLINSWLACCRINQNRHGMARFHTVLSIFFSKLAARVPPSGQKVCAQDVVS